MSLERSPLDKVETSIKRLKKLIWQKCHRLIHFLKKYLYIHNKFVTEKCFNRPYIFINEKTFKI